MPFFKTRSVEKELMDLGPSHFTEKEYSNCLDMLGKIGVFLRGNTIALKAISLHPSTETLLDIGCGGGDFAFSLAKHLPEVKVTGVDIEKLAIEYAKARFKRDNLSFVYSETPELPFKDKSFDIVTANLVCHHLDGDNLIAFLKQACRIAKKAVVITDLNRHPLSYAGFALLSSLFFRNRLIQNDGLISIKKGFKMEDWEAIFEEAGIGRENVIIKRRWPYRWCIQISIPN